jgi:hypothetical protein
MAKKCNHCGTVVDDGITPCPKCDNIAFTDLPKVELTREQLQELEKAVAEKLSKSSHLTWRLTWRVALVMFAILGIPGAIVGWSIWSSMQSFEQTATKDVQTKFAVLTANLSNSIENAHTAISNDVASKFSAYAQEANRQLASSSTKRP